MYYIIFALSFATITPGNKKHNMSIKRVANILIKIYSCQKG